MKERSVDDIFQRGITDLDWEYHRAKAEHREMERHGTLDQEEDAWQSLMELWSKRPRTPRMWDEDGWQEL